MATSFLFYFFLKKHLKRLRKTENELEEHRTQLEDLVREKTKDLDKAILKLSSSNTELQEKSKVIEVQNTELKETLLELKEAQAQLLHADKMASLGIMTAGIAHEINNPLNYIAGGVTGLENYLSEEQLNNEKIILFIKSIKVGVDRVSSIVSGLNQMSRSVESYDEKCDIHNIIDNCLIIMNSQLKNRVEIVREFSGTPVILGNVGQLHQVFSNILLNASQAIQDKGKITISTEMSSGNVRIQITDNGSGISEENLVRVTDPFFTTKEPGKGTGLGLSIAYNLIQAHNGKLKFDSEIGKGTTVTINLPEKPNIND